ncbi:protein PHLOEM PROTEIN 2-LIKE A1-like [Pistacia vera]|uniref:protein PHLOEM PROTEIN 2-LIKE A1-like n=1 Tax=Pistacia vera TaxID=55513 RepID=UPI001262E7A5|nr:protein PHLOEM PROTEIN 2-LIKE A1-like [Pistacia vera]
MASAQVALPQNFHAIIKDADSEIDTSSTEKVFKQLQSGVFLKNNKQKCTYDQSSNATNFQLFAKDLIYEGGDWIWDTDSGSGVEVAELESGTSIKVTGNFDTSKLSPAKTYAVSFTIKMKNDAEGWESPVTMEFDLPTGVIKKITKNLSQQRSEVWVKHTIGDFTVPSNGMSGVMKIFLSSSDDKKKKGIVIREIDITAK